MPEVSIIIINWNTRDLLRACLHSIERTTAEMDLEVIVVDNASNDGSPAMLQDEFPEVRLIQNTENLGFARPNNQAARTARGEFLFLLNSDTELQPGSLQALLALVKSQAQAGIAGAHLINPDGSFQASHTPFPTLGREFLILSGLGRALYGRWFPSRGPGDGCGPQPADYVEGAALLIRRTPYLQLGGLDEGYFMYSEEVDLCYTFKQAGWQVWYHPEARILHHGGASSRTRQASRQGDLYRSRVRFFQKHYGKAPAAALKLLIYGLTTVKYILNSILRLLTGGQGGRVVISPAELAAKLERK